jgi:uncharacterized protein (UPF0332 family)
VLFPDYYEIARVIVTFIIDRDDLVMPVESRFRSAMNRLYYSMFHNVQRYFPEFRIRENDKIMVHQKLLDFLIEHAGGSLGDKFTKMRELRVQADYHHDQKVSKADFEKMLLLHDAMIELLERARPR